MSFGRRIRPFVDHELAAAEAARRSGDDAAGFRFLERAHVLGQLLRIAGAAVLT